MALLTQWLREVIAAQAWLAWAQPYIARAPDWALLAALALVVLLLVWALFRPRSKPQAEPNAKLPRGTAAPAAPVTPPPAAKATPAAPQDAQAPSIPANSDDNRAVRVFISSTFIDMEGERNVLVKQTFPALRTKFRARGVEFLEIDLRWGVTEEEVQTGKTLPICLAEVDRCKPYFVGLLGERYGSLLSPDKLTPELQEAFPVLREGVGRSLTEIEIMQGVLRNRESASRALFFQRDPAWLKTLSAQERAQYETGDDADRAKLTDLKARIRASGARIIDYARPEDIGPAVEAALSELIEARFPEADAPDAFTQTLRLHGAYARERRGLHIGAEPYLAALDQWMAKGDAPPMLITGASGGGKSTLIANWLHAWRGAHPNDIVFEHYLGASPDSADPMLLMRRLWEHLNRATGETVDLPAGNAELMDVASGLAQRLAQANMLAERNGANILIALDGLDKLSSEQNLRWLMNVPRVKLVASSLDGEAKAAAVARGWTALEVKPLSDAERGEFIESTLKGWGRKLLPEQIAAILAHAQAGNPLFLKTLLDELRVSATHARLDERLAIYLGARDMPDLFARMLERLEADCEPGLVTKALPLIWASRAGLEETEIIAITGATPLAWATLRNGLGDGLRDQAGRLAFSHDFLRLAVETRYLETEDRKHAAHLAIVNRFEQRDADARQAEELPFQLRAAQAWDRLEALLTDLDRFDLLRARGDSELLGYWLPLKERKREPEALLCGVFETRAGEAEQWTHADIDLAFALGRFLGIAGVRGEGNQRLGERRTTACERLLGVEHSDTLTSMNNLAETLRARGDLQGAQKLQERVIEVMTRIEHPGILASANNLALTLHARGDLAGALELQQRILESMINQLGPEHPVTLMGMSNLALTLRDHGDFAGAHELHERVLEVRRRVLGPAHPDTIAGMVHLAGTLQVRGDLDGACELGERALEAGTRLLGAEHPSTLTSMNNLATTLRARGDLEGAQKLNERLLEITTRLFGPEHSVTLTSMANFAESLRARSDLDGAQRLQERVLQASARVLGVTHPDTITSMNKLAATLSARSDLEGAQKLNERVLDARTRLLGAEHALTLASMVILAGTLTARRDLEGAQKLQERVLEARMRLLGAEHDDVLESMNNLATTLQARGNLDGAQKLQERVLEASTRVYGAEHLHTLVSMNNLSATLSARGDLDGAQKLHERVLEARTRTLGAEHPHTLTSMAWVASTLKARGDLDGAQKLHERVLEARTRVLGPEHLDTLRGLANLAGTLFARGDLKGAQTYQERVLELRTRVLGPGHPDTESAAEGVAVISRAIEEQKKH